MALKTARFVNLFLATVVMGVTLCQVAASADKLLGNEAVTLRPEMLFSRGWNTLVGGVEIGALVSAVMVACWVRHKRWSFLLTLVGVVCLADLVIMRLLFLIPSTWQTSLHGAGSASANWGRLWSEWVCIDGIRTAFAGGGYSALLLALVVDTPRAARRAATVTRLTAVKSARDAAFRPDRDARPDRGTARRKRPVESPEHHLPL
jgi:hypothetical protein